MRRPALLLPPLLAALAAAVPAAGAPRTQALDPPALAAKLTACDVGPNAADRSAGFEGTMPAAEGAETLGMRFDLQVRRGTGRWKVLSAPTFGRWVSSAPGAAGYVYDKRVESLDTGAQYRVVVRFRWKDADGAVVRTAQRTSPACKQPDLRPDLQVSAIDVVPGAGGRTTYRVTVVNNGKAPVAVPFAVAFRLGRQDPVRQTVPALDTLASTTVSFTGPACGASTTLRATADPDDAIAEVREGDNALAAACPAQG